MIFKETDLKGAYIIEIEPRQDERGYFARSFCQNEFKEKSLNPCVAQSNASYSKKKGTLRGLHYQVAPYEEAKLIRCTRGAIFDVIIDLRPQSPTFCQWFAAELSEENCKMLYVPEGFAHGYQVLKDETSVFYQVSEFYHPECERGVRWDDSSFGIKWPISKAIISLKDRQLPDFVR
jgi:dTDP-4-dehydrorhamnose 3,5-epimerase